MRAEELPDGRLRVVSTGRVREGEATLAARREVAVFAAPERRRLRCASSSSRGGRRRRRASPSPRTGTSSSRAGRRARGLVGGRAGRSRRARPRGGRDVDGRHAHGPVRGAHELPGRVGPEERRRAVAWRSRRGFPEGKRERRGVRLAHRPGARRYRRLQSRSSRTATELWSFSNVEGGPVRPSSGHLGPLEPPDRDAVAEGHGRRRAPRGGARGGARRGGPRGRPSCPSEDRGSRARRRAARHGAAAELGASPLGCVRRPAGLRDASVHVPVVAPDGAVRFAERTVSARGGAPLGEVREAFRLSATPMSVTFRVASRSSLRMLHRHGVADLLRLERRDEIVVARDLLSGDADDDVAEDERPVRGRAAVPRSPAFAAPVPSCTPRTRTPETPSRRMMPSVAPERCRGAAGRSCRAR